MVAGMECGNHAPSVTHSVGEVFVAAILLFWATLLVLLGGSIIHLWRRSRLEKLGDQEKSGAWMALLFWDGGVTLAMFLFLR
jgi:hypothetical protein